MSTAGESDARVPRLDWSRLRLKSRAARAHKVAAGALGKATPAGCSFGAWFEALPDFLGARELRGVVQALVAARRAGRPVVFAFGGHVIKTGCSPLVIDLIERGLLTALATNGSGAIHDLELAETGATSEEVADTIRDGSFGMVRETCERMNAAARAGAAGVGLGRALGQLLADGPAPYQHLSLFAAAARAGIPATVHVAIGTDTVHMHPEADGAAIGAATLADFRTICDVVADLGAAGPGQAGGVWLNCGSAVVLPEVFLKAVSVARNLGHMLDGMHTANFDMLRHYRPTQNVVQRPVAAGHGHTVLGQHELLLPLLRQAVIEAWGA
ncbi:MAG TPA: hypothetical protein PLP66_00545 [Phycisphaerae bacterium]|nr:hypothetical protein [Phycisphaerae bacterium]